VVAAAKGMTDFEGFSAQARRSLGARGDGIAEI